jgi:hypothetical protein
MTFVGPRMRLAEACAGPTQILTWAVEQCAQLSASTNPSLLIRLFMARSNSCTGS